MPNLQLLVLKTTRLDAVRDFYSEIGFEFVEEQHGKGPVHFSAPLGAGILEVYDRRQFERVCKEQGVGYPFGPSHQNVKSLFATATGISHEVGLDGAFERLGLEMEGTHHRGDDDAWNIARVLCRLLKAIRSTEPS